MAEGKETTKETSNEFIEVKFTGEEITDIGMSMAKKVTELERLESQKSAAAADFTSRIKQKIIEINEASRKIQDGFEMRYEDCDVVMNHENHRVYFYFRDERVKDRKMTPDEIQMPLPIA